jgi:hypothetical protein
VIWITSGLLFLAPFVDPRRPFRWLHVDLIVLVAFGTLLVRTFGAGGSLWAYRAGIVSVAVGLLYVLVRMLVQGFRPRPQRQSLVPLVPTRWLALAAVAMALFHVVYVATTPKPVIDVGQASVWGADRILRGEGLYDDPFPKPYPYGNTYGPANYLLYVPFEWAHPSVHAGNQMVAARAAALTFDLLTGLGLFFLGRRLRRHGGGTLLGAALAFAWFSYPYTLFVLAYSFNDALVAFLLVMSLMAVTRPGISGATTAVAAAVKFAPAAVAPLFATAPAQRRLRSSMLFTATFAAVTVALFVPFIPDGGIRELYERTVGFQEARRPAGSVWALSSYVHPAQAVIRAAAVALSVVVAVVPARKTAEQLAALAVAVLVSFQLGLSYWIPSYVVWFAPFVFVAIFVPYAAADERAPDHDGQAVGSSNRGVATVESR